MTGARGARRFARAAALAVLLPALVAGALGCESKPRKLESRL